MRVICYGDSNTYGWDPSNLFGEPYNNQWPMVYAKLSGNEVLNCGEPGREIPSGERRLNLLKDQLNREKPFDHIFVMLGTNDILNMTVPSVKPIAKKMEEFLNICVEFAPVTLVGIPPIRCGIYARDNAARELNVEYEILAKALNIPFIDISDWNLSLAFDGFHLTEEAHITFGEEIHKACHNLTNGGKINKIDA